MTYLLLNTAFLAPVLAVAVAAIVVARQRNPAGVARSLPALLIGLVAIVIATAVFDNVIIATGIVDYDAARISGAKIGVAPVEDFAYAIAAAVLLPALWVLLRRPRARA